MTTYPEYPGLPLPAPVPDLVRFLIERPNNKRKPSGKWDFPFIVWVYRDGEERKEYTCTACTGLVYKVDLETMPIDLHKARKGENPYVCNCMGRFVE